jgi:hypothetical protein
MPCGRIFGQISLKCTVFAKKLLLNNTVQVYQGPRCRMQYTVLYLKLCSNSGWIHLLRYESVYANENFAER